MGQVTTGQTNGADALHALRTLATKWQQAVNLVRQKAHGQAQAASRGTSAYIEVELMLTAADEREACARELLHALELWERDRKGEPHEQPHRAGRPKAG
jgi:hypothetical protein